jgi:hypothetical protein
MFKTSVCLGGEVSPNTPASSGSLNYPDVNVHRTQNRRRTIAQNAFENLVHLS